MLIHRKDGWKALPYIWNEAGPMPVSVTGGTRAVSWIDVNGVEQSTGLYRAQYQ
ncbi:MAG: hypothetical protein R3E50_14440 [Halioglobus sp.]